MAKPRKFKQGREIRKWKSNLPEAREGKLRIVGGSLRGRQIQYSGDPVTRPMKDPTREALFNLVGGWVPGKIVFDLFAGTGAVGIEAISRGAEHGIFIERHFPTVKIIQQNLNSLDIATIATVESSDTFFWCRQWFQSPNLAALTTGASRETETDLNRLPWAIFCCPPYALFQERQKDLHQLICGFKDMAPPGSMIVVESDDRFDPHSLPDLEHWQVRNYPPAVISVWRDTSLDEF